jgi:hypothetical protein
VQARTAARARSKLDAAFHRVPPCPVSCWDKIYSLAAAEASPWNSLPWAASTAPDPGVVNHALTAASRPRRRANGKMPILQQNSLPEVRPASPGEEILTKMPQI